MKNAVIIGAGPAGLTAALELLRRSDEYSVTVLEAENSIGGISKTVEINGCRMDIGGHRFHTDSERVLEFWKSIMPCQGAPAFDELATEAALPFDENGADPEKTDAVLLRRKRVSRIYRKGKLYDYPVSLSTLWTMGFEAVPAGLSYLAAQIKKRDETTLEDFYINRFGKRLYRTFFESYTEKVWGVHPSKMSPDCGTQRVGGLSVWQVVKDMFTGKSNEASLIKSFLYPKLGPGQLWEIAAGEIEKLGGCVMLNTCVDGVKIRDNRVTAVISGETEYPADLLVSSMPLSTLVGIIDNVPKTVRMVAEGLQFRDFITVGVAVKRMRLKCKNKDTLPHDCWIYVQEPNIKMGRIQIFNNWSPYMVERPGESIFIGTEYFCFEGDGLWNTTDEEMSALAVSELNAMGIADKTDVLFCHCERMKKAYPSYDGGYKELEKIRTFADEVSNLYCIGRNGQHRYNNMDASMLTAMTAVDIILNGGEKSKIWYVDTLK